VDFNLDRAAIESLISITESHRIGHVLRECCLPGNGPIWAPTRTPTLICTSGALIAKSPLQELSYEFRNVVNLAL
jgi:hypothetical protein